MNGLGIVFEVSIKDYIGSTFVGINDVMRKENYDLEVDVVGVVFIGCYNLRKLGGLRKIYCNMKYIRGNFYFIYIVFCR